MFRVILDYLWLPKRIKTINPKGIITLGNLPLPTKNSNQVLYLHNAFLIYDKYSEFNLPLFDALIHHLRRLFFNHRMKYVNLIVTQTRLMKKGLKSRHNYSYEKIIVLPNTRTIYPQKTPTNSFSPINPDRINILVLSRYYPHKNLEILMDVASLIRKYKKNYTLITTIDKNQHPKAKKLINRIYRGNNDIIINIGKIETEYIKFLYDNIDALLLPSLLESFSSTHVDAMFFMKPVITSDRAFAREICGEAGWYFNPHSPDDILNVLDQCFLNEQKRNTKIKKGREMVEKFPSWNEIANQLLKVIEL